MSTSPGRATSQLRRMRSKIGRRRRRMRHNLFSTMQIAASQGEDTFWKQLAECEEGRLAQEADHLFDTSFAWAA